METFKSQKRPYHHCRWHFCGALLLVFALLSGALPFNAQSTFAATQVASGLNNPDELVLDGGYVYFTDNSSANGYVKRVPQTGGSPTTLVSGAVLYDSGAYRGVNLLKVTPANIFGHYGGYVTCNIFEAPKNGGAFVNIISGISGGGLLAVVNTNVYYFTGFSTIYQTSTNGGSSIQLLSGVWPRSSAFDQSAIYFVDYNTKDVKRFDLTSHSLSTLISGNSSEGSLFINTSYVFFNINGSVKRVPKAGGSVVTLVSSGNATGYAADDTEVFFVNGQTIGSVTVAGGSTNTLQYISSPTAVASMAVDDYYLYWADVSGGNGAGAIYRIPKNGNLGWLIETYRNGSAVSGLADADNLIAGGFVIASTNMLQGDMVGFDSGEGTGHFAVNNPVPGISNSVATDNYAVQGTGYLIVPTSGQYTFGLNTDDGARLRIDGVDIIVDSVRSPPHDSAYVAVSLSAGSHSIEWTWYNTAGGANGGGAEAEIFAAPGSNSSFNSAFKLVGDPSGLEIIQPQPLTVTPTNRTPTIAETTQAVQPPGTSPTQLVTFVTGVFTTNAPSPSKMTIVLTHGWNDSPNGWATNMAQLILDSGISPNIVAWDWSVAAKSSITDPGTPASQTRNQGFALGEALLQALGANYSQPIHFIGHSLGTLVNASAANYLHGDRLASEITSPTPWAWMNTQMTLFDEAEVGTDVNSPQFLNDAMHVLYDSGNFLVWRPWYFRPMPVRCRWADNFVTAFGLLQTNAANFILTNEFPAYTQWLPTFGNEITAFHDYPYIWYDDTIQNLGYPVGWNWSFERGGFDNAPATNTVFMQHGSSWEVDPVSWSYATNYLDGRIQRYNASLGFFARNVEGPLIEAFSAFGQVSGEDLMASTPNTIINIKTANGSTQTPQSSGLQVFNTAMASGTDSNVPAYAWILVAVPSNAVAMSFDFQLVGDGAADSFVAAINGTNVLSLAANLIETNLLMNSGQINVSALAGQTTELFFGIIGGTSTNAQITVQDILFYTVSTNAVDSIGDGIPDWWRAQYFPNVDPTGATTNDLSCATCDADGTGQNNLMKYLSGIDPIDSGSFWGIEASPTNGLAPLIVNFAENSTSLAITNRSWSFGDGVTATGTNPTHTYTNGGMFTVSLTIFNLGGSASLVVSNLVTVTIPSTILADAGDLFDKLGNLAPTNSVAVLVVDTGTNGFANPQPDFSLSLGATWGTDDKVVGLWDLTACLCGNGELFDQTVVAYTNGIVPGQKLQLYWFPSLTSASNTLGITSYGKYTDTNSPPRDGSDAWQIPPSGTNIHLKFWTTFWGGTNSESAGLATSLTAPPTTILADAGNLFDRFGNLAPTNSVAVLVVDTGNNGFVDPQPTFPVSLGATWGTDDKIVGLWNLTNAAADYGNGELYDQTVVGYTNGITPGQKLQLYWFPSLTLASNIVGITYYGKYTDANNPALDGSDAWTIPTFGSSVHLKFWTAFWGGSNPEIAGRATLLSALTSYQNWQVQYFGGTNSPNAAVGADADGTGQNNLFKYVAGLDPTNHASVFALSLASVSNQTGMNLNFNPLALGRTYTPQFSTDLASHVWLPLTGYAGAVTNGSQITITDPNASQSKKFYRIDISLP